MVRHESLAFGKALAWSDFVPLRSLRWAGIGRVSGWLLGAFIGDLSDFVACYDDGHPNDFTICFHYCSALRS